MENHHRHQHTVAGNGQIHKQQWQVGVVNREVVVCRVLWNCTVLKVCVSIQASDTVSHSDPPQVENSLLIRRFKGLFSILVHSEKLRQSDAFIQERTIESVCTVHIFIHQ